MNKSLTLVNACRGFSPENTSSTRVWFAWADGVHFPAHCSTRFLPVFSGVPVSGGAPIAPAIRGSPLPDLGGEKVSDQLRQRAILSHGHQLEIATERRRQATVERLGLLCFLAPAWSGVCLLWGSARAGDERRSWGGRR